MTISKLISGHGRFQKSFAKHRESWARLAREGQQPHTLWIGCSDSRVIPEQITASRSGELFVLRNIANVVPPYGTTGDSAAAVIEFGVLELGVQQIIVCGHTFCAGVGAVLDQGSLTATSHIARWTSWVAPAVSQVNASGVPEEERYQEAIKANIILQRGNVISYPAVSKAMKSGRLSVYGWLFDIESGALIAHDEATNQWQRVLSLQDNQATNSE